jgi:hypothetical protein
MPTHPKWGVFCATGEVLCDECGATFFAKDYLGTYYYAVGVHM